MTPFFIQPKQKSNRGLSWHPDSSYRPQKEKEWLAFTLSILTGWCRKFSKEPNDSRFATFASNYMKMEAFAIKTGDRMQFNEWYNRIFREKENAKSREEKAEAKSVAKAEK